MKINKFYLNSLAEASVTNMKSMFYASNFNQDISKWDVSSVKEMTWMFQHSEFYHNIGSWNLFDKTIKEMFFDKGYTEQNYIDDRKNYLEIINNNIYIENETNKLNKELNKNIELSTLEMEF